MPWWSPCGNTMYIESEYDQVFHRGWRCVLLYYGAIKFPLRGKLRIIHDQLPANTKHLLTFAQRQPNVFDVGPTLYKCYTNVLCLLGGGYRSLPREAAFSCVRFCLSRQSVCNHIHIIIWLL